MQHYTCYTEKEIISIDVSDAMLAPMTHCIPLLIHWCLNLVCEAFLTCDSKGMSVCIAFHGMGGLLLDQLYGAQY